MSDPTPFPYEDDDHRLPPRTPYDQDKTDPHAAARGIIHGVIICIPIWAGLALLTWIATR